MRILIGSQCSYKTTVMLHLIYNALSPYAVNEEGDPLDNAPYALLLTSKRRLGENSMTFGTYCEVTIDTLKLVKIKYVEDFEGLVQFLADFHLLPRKPFVLAIDSLDHFTK